jgi:aminomuconate-semialdehyde/2-hydroxymuconate-6-semialdehyde dehydrogenase
MEILQNYIDGKLVDAISTDRMDIYDPARGEVYGSIPVSKDQDIALAVEAASNAFNYWSGLSPHERAGWLQRIAEGIIQNSDKLSAAESLDNGKPVKLAKELDIPRAAANFQFFSGAILHNASQAFHTNSQILNYTNHIPIGVVGCISPWNLPLYLLTWKIAPALAVGNCVVAKPSEITPYTAYLLSEICMETGLPPGVLNIVHGPGDPTGSSIVSHPMIKAISFTGGTETGRKIASVAAPMFKKLSLELGGKNPNIIFDDCDFQTALSTTIKSSFTNQGEICLCGSRVFIQKGIYHQFKEALIERAKDLVPADPAESDTRMGAIVSQEHLEKVLGYIALARSEGGEILTGGERVMIKGRCEGGYFIQPTIIEGLANSCRTNQEEIFGPVITLIPFENEAQVIEWANEVDYGLSATIWTRDLSRAHRVARAIKSGVVWVNCWMIRDLRTPFGGMKQSGVGREGGAEALRFFTETQNVCIQI